MLIIKLFITLSPLRLQAQFALVLSFLCLAFSHLAAYEILWTGIDDAELLQLVQSESNLEKLKNNPPSTLTALKKRASGDVSNILDVLQSRAYYGATLEIAIEEKETVASSVVKVIVHLGPIYPFGAFNIRYLQYGTEISSCDLPFQISLKDLGVEIGAPALPEAILLAEDKLQGQLNERGYAFAKVERLDVFADQKEMKAIVWLAMDIGTPAAFGPLKIVGLERVRECFIKKKVQWQQGDLYDPRKIEKTQEALELSGLFRSVGVAQAESPTDRNEVPMEIAVIEAKQRTIGFGVSYTTSLGPGASLDWEDRNIFGEGQKLSFRSNIWEKLQEGRLSYTLPDFMRERQNLVWLLEYDRERTKSYTENAVALSGVIERKVNDQLLVSYGGMLKRLRSQRSEFNGTFNLIKVPLQFRWSSADSIMEPTKGGVVQFKTVPSLQVHNPKFAYCINLLTGSFYKSLTEDKRHIFAAKLMVGSILGGGKNDIPPPERFYAGSESTLRGYHYLTVSPIARHHHKPLGGRSLVVGSLELRSRFGKDLGAVAFYDVGNVHRSAMPGFVGKMRQSVGVGLRYFTVVGPIRLDIAFPLNRRKHIDSALEAYFSIGQAF